MTRTWPAYRSCWLSILDGRPGRAWQFGPDPDSPDDELLDGDDPLCRVTPTDPESLHRMLSTWYG